MFNKIYQYLKPISISLSPNTEKDDIFLALKIIFHPRLWKSETKEVGSPLSLSISKLEDEFKKYLGIKSAFSFNSGRTALMAILNSLELNKNDEVLLQAFTCNAVINPILWLGLMPVYVDCDEKTFNIDTEDLQKKITPKSKVLIIQHTFGFPADIEKISRICQENNLILIEDCAHSLGAEYGGKLVGTFGKASFFSFSRDKVISCVYGGMAVTNDEILAEKIKEFQKKIGYPSRFWIFQQLLHPVLMNWIVLPTYRILGKYLLLLFQWLHILSKAVHWKEKRGEKPNYFPKRLPSALAILALNQFKKLERFNKHRQKIANFYCQELLNTKYHISDTEYKKSSIFLRFPVKHNDAHKIIKRARKNNLLIGDWCDNVIAPKDTNLDKMKYETGSCPKAEKLAKITFNLPTHINVSETEARKIIKLIKFYGN